MQTTRFEDTTTPDSKLDRTERLSNHDPKPESEVANFTQLKTTEHTVEELSALAAEQATSAIKTATTIEGIGIAQAAARADQIAQAEAAQEEAARVELKLQEVAMSGPELVANLAGVSSRVVMLRSIKIGETAGL